MKFLDLITTFKRVAELRTCKVFDRAKQIVSGKKRLRANYFEKIFEKTIIVRNNGHGTHWHSSILVGPDPHELPLERD